MVLNERFNRLFAYFALRFRFFEAIVGLVGILFFAIIKLFYSIVINRLMTNSLFFSWLRVSSHDMMSVPSEVSFDDSLVRMVVFSDSVKPCDS